MPFGIDNEKLSEKYKAIRNKIEALKIIKFNALPVYDDRYIKPKIRAYGNEVYTNFRELNLPKDYINCEPFYSHFY